jgi:dihydrofolate reductase
LSWLDAPPGLRWLGVGCGTGALTAEAVRHCARRTCSGGSRARSVADSGPGRRPSLSKGAAEYPNLRRLRDQPNRANIDTLTDPKWADTTVLSDDLAAAVGELEAKEAGELQVNGTRALTRWLLENDLVDEVNLLIVQVVVGQGTRLFPDTGPDMALDLVESRAFPQGPRVWQKGRSHGQRELAECCREAELRRDRGGEFVVSAAEVLRERVARRQRCARRGGRRRWWSSGATWSR